MKPDVPNPYVFPVNTKEQEFFGIKIRDLFAIVVTHAVIVNHPPSTVEECDHLAKRAYDMADALLKARIAE